MQKSLTKVLGKVTEHIVLPQLSRSGNLATGTLVGLGLSAQHADWLQTVLVGAVLIGLDLLASFMGRTVRKDREANGENAKRDELHRNLDGN